MLEYCYMKKNPLMLLVVGLVATTIITVAVMYFYNRAADVNQVGDEGPIYQACTEEAKLCPDGSAVGRIGPNCEFAPCP